MAGSAASAAAAQVANLAMQEVSFLCRVHDAVESLREDWRSLQTFLSVEAQRGSSRDAIAADSVRRVRDAAYEAENIIDAADYRAKRNSRRNGILGAMSRYTHKPMDLIAHHKLGKDVLRWRKKIQDIKSSREFLDAMKAGAPEPRANHTCLSRLALDCNDESSVVGLDGDAKRIEEWLKDAGTPQLTVISIVAMGGAGKTTLARKVYNSAAAKEHFDALAFVSISQQFEVHPVLKEIATQAMGIRTEERGFNTIGMSSQVDELKNVDERELVRLVHNFLNGKRYLVVLDDVWRTDTWDAIQHAFPDEGNGSRVITMRKMQVAKQANLLTNVHEVMLLKEQESWQLFSLKAFPSYANIDASNRQKLETVGKNLAKKCNGLPLSLVILGSHLSKNLSLDTWSKMDRCLDWELTSKGHNMKQIIALSYDDLPSHFLKHCFLYIASFPEDYRIHVHFLTSSWIAEGFLPHRPNRTLEDMSYDYLQELAQRSMIRVYWDDYSGRISGVEMHDSLRDWAMMQQAKKEGFLKVCKNHDDVSDGTSACRSYFQDFFDKQICINAPNTRSVLGFHLPSATLGTLRFLRVIHKFDTNLKNISKVISRFIHLRYIAFIRCKNVALPSSIGKLLNLQSIDLTGTRIPRVPKSLWDIPTLRNVRIPDVVASFNVITIRAEEQTDLHTLILDSAWHGPINKLGTNSSRWILLKKYFMRMTQLRTLVLAGTRNALPVDVLISLKEHRHLETLMLHVWESGGAFPGSDRLPQNLRQLGLYFFRSTWNSWHTDLLPTLGRLQSLVILGLSANYRREDAEDPGGQITSQCCQKVGETTYDEASVMSSPAGAFPQLQYLTLYGVQANKLRFQTGTMPKLDKLKFGDGHMTAVPDGLFNLLSLKDLELLKMKNVLPRETHELIESKGIKVIIRDD